MATQVQFRRGTTTENNAFTGAAAELTVDTTLTTIRVHDGTTAGGVPIINTSSAQTVTNKTFGNGNTWQGNAPTLAYGGTGDNLTAVQGGVVYSTDAEMAISLAGTAGQVLTSGGTAAPIWVTPSNLTVGTATSATSASNVLGGSAGYLVYQYDTDDTRFIEPGTTGYVLQSTGASTAPAWVTSDVTIGSSAITLGGTVTDFEGLTSIDGTTGLTSAFTTPTGSVSLLTSASAVSIGASTSTVTVNDDLVVTGNFTVNGTTTTINSTTLTVDDKNVVLASGAADSSAADGAGITVDGANANITYNHVGTQWELDKPVYLSDTTDSSSSTTGALIVAGGIGAAGNIVCDGEFSIVGDIAVNGGDITTDDATFNIVNADATTVNIGGAASAINMGASTSTVTFADDVSVGGNLAVTGNSTFTGTVTFNGGTINLGDAATDNVVIGADVNSDIIPNTDGTYDLGSSSQEWQDLYIDGTAHIDTLDVDENATITGTLGVTGNTTITADLAVNGGDLTTTAGTFNLINTNATTANIAGAATAVNIGASTGTLTVNNAQTVFDSTDSIQIPVGTTAQRDGTPAVGQIRYNSTISSFEGFGPGNAWGSLGGVKDVDQDTYLLTEASAGSDEDTFEFYNATVNTLSLSGSAFDLKSPVTMTVNNTTDASSSTTGAVIIDGGVGIAKKLYVGTNAAVGGTLGVTGATTLSSTLDVTGLTNFNNTTDSTSLTSASVVFDGGVSVTKKLHVGGNGEVDGNLVIDGNLTVNGTTVTIDTTNLAVADSMIYMNEGNTTENIDTGWASNYNDGTYQHCGVFRDASDGVFKIYDSYTPEPGTAIDITHASYDHADLQVGGMTIDDNASVGGTLTVTGATTMNSNLDLNGNLDVSGNITSSSGAISFGNENLSTTGTLASGALTITGNTTISGDLQVNGGDITSSTGAISFGNENLSTTGTLSAGAITGSSLNLSTGAVTAGSLDISGNVDVDGTMEADAYTVNGTALNEYIADTAGAMFSGNTESLITVTYQDADNTIDVSHNSVSRTNNTSTDSPGSAGTFTAIDSITTSTEGHITAVNTKTVTMPTCDNYVSWTIKDGDTTTYTVTSGDTLQIAEGNDIDSNFTADDVLTISHKDVSRSNTTDTGTLSHSGTFTAITGVTSSARGHVTGVETTTYTLPAGAIPNNATITLSAGTGVSGGGNFTTDQSGNETITFSIGQDVATTADVRFDSFGVGTAASGTTGEIRATNQITSYYSDARLKNFNGTIENALDKVMALNGYYFTVNDRAKELGYTDEAQQVGISAQEVEAVMPEVVTDAAINSNIPEDQERDYKTVHYDRMVPLLIEAIKEQQKQIDELKAKLGE